MNWIDISFKMGFIDPNFGMGIVLSKRTVDRPKVVLEDPQVLPRRRDVLHLKTDHAPLSVFIRRKKHPLWRAVLLSVHRHIGQVNRFN